MKPPEVPTWSEWHDVGLKLVELSGMPLRGRGSTKLRGVFGEMLAAAEAHAILAAGPEAVGLRRRPPLRAWNAVGFVLESADRRMFAGVYAVAKFTAANVDDFARALGALSRLPMVQLPNGRWVVFKGDAPPGTFARDVELAIAEHRPVSEATAEAHGDRAAALAEWNEIGEALVDLRPRYFIDMRDLGREVVGYAVNDLGVPLGCPAVAWQPCRNRGVA